MFKRNQHDSSGPDFRSLNPENAEDMAQLSALEQESFSTPWSQQQYLALMRSGVCRVFGAFLGGVLLGYVAAAMHKEAGEIEIYNVAVRREVRRKGVGKRLLSLLLQAGRQNGMGRAVLEVRSGNVPAIGLYQGLGFRQCGLRKFYYSDTGEDALVYELVSDKI